MTGTATAWRQVYQRPDTTTPATATDYGLRFLAGRNLDPGLEADVGTVIAQLASNAARHGTPPITVALAITRDGIDVHVSDTGSITAFGPDRTGLAVVRQIARGRLEVRGHGTAPGKTVTARIPYTTSPASTGIEGK